MIDQLQNFIDALVDLRWLIVALTILSLGTLYAASLDDARRAIRALDREREWNDELEAENAVLRRRLLLNSVAAPDPRRAPVVALRPREEVRRG